MRESGRLVAGLAFGCLLACSGGMQRPQTVPVVVIETPPAGVSSGRAGARTQKVGAAICESLTRCTPSLDCDDEVVATIENDLAPLGGETMSLFRRCLAMPDCEESDRCVGSFLAVYVPSKS